MIIYWFISSTIILIHWNTIEIFLIFVINFTIYNLNILTH